MPRKPTVTIQKGDGKSVIYIETALARAADPQLDKLVRAEEKLGRLRNCLSVAEGGSHPEVDELYREMHARNAEVQVLLAREVILGLVGQVDGDERHLRTIAEGARYDRFACDGHCFCSPAVVVPGLRRGGRTVAVMVN